MANPENTVQPIDDSPMGSSDQPNKVFANEENTTDGSYKVGAGELKLTKLGQNNYRVWSQVKQLNLIGKKLWGLVDGSVSQPGPERPINTASWVFDDSTVMTYIFGGVEDNQIQHITLLSSANAQWDQLKIIHNAVGRSRLVLLMRRFNNNQISGWLYWWNYVSWLQSLRIFDLISS